MKAASIRIASCSYERKAAKTTPMPVGLCLVLIATLLAGGDDSVVALEGQEQQQPLAVSIASASRTQEFGKPTHVIALINTGDVVINATLARSDADPAVITWSGGTPGSSNRQRLVSTSSPDTFDITVTVPGQSPVALTIHVLDATPPPYNTVAGKWPVEAGINRPAVPEGLLRPDVHGNWLRRHRAPGVLVAPYFSADRWVFQLNSGSTRLMVRSAFGIQDRSPSGESRGIPVDSGNESDEVTGRGQTRPRYARANQPNESNWPPDGSGPLFLLGRIDCLESTSARTLTTSTRTGGNRRWICSNESDVEGPEHPSCSTAPTVRGGPSSIKQVADRLHGANQACAAHPDVHLEVLLYEALGVHQGREAGRTIVQAVAGRPSRRGLLRQRPARGRRSAVADHAGPTEGAGRSPAGRLRRHRLRLRDRRPAHLDPPALAADRQDGGRAAGGADRPRAQRAEGSRLPARADHPRVELPRRGSPAVPEPSCVDRSQSVGS